MAENKKQKILYLITKSNFGGAQRYVYHLAKGTHEEGHDVIVGFGGDGILGQKLTDAGIKTVQLPSLARDISLFRDIKTFLKLLNIMVRESPDVVHLNSSKIGGIGALAARIENGRIHAKRIFGAKRTPIKIIFTGHGWALHEERPDWQRFVIALSHWLTIMLAQHTIAVSRRTYEEVASLLPLTKNKMRVIYNGIDVFPLAKPPQALLELFDNEALLKSKPLIIGTIAELHKNKGLTYALEGLALLKKQTNQPFVFVVIGEGEERAALEAMRDRLGLTDTVFFVGFKSEARALLSAFDVFLFTSIKEGFPYAILEAGNAGLPVVATAVGGIPEVIDDMRSGILIQSKNPGEIARALSYLIEHEDRKNEFGRAIKERTLGRFNIETMIKETIVLYRS